MAFEPLLELQKLFCFGLDSTCQTSNRNSTKKSKQWLVKTILEMAGTDDAVFDFLQLSLAADEDDKKAFDFSLTDQISSASQLMEKSGPGPKTRMHTADFDNAADVLTNLFLSKMPALKLTLETSEFALMQLDCAWDLQEEDELEYLFDAFEGLHVEACKRLMLSPRDLGKRLAKLKEETEHGFFAGPPANYIDLLGQDGLAAYLAAVKG